MKPRFRLPAILCCCLPSFLPAGSLAGSSDPEIIAALEVWRNGGTSDDAAAAFVTENLDLLGSPNPRIRDELFFSLLDVQVRRNRFAPGELNRLLERLFSEAFLFARLEDAGAGQACRRSFSVLALARIIQAHNLRGFLPPGRPSEAAAVVMRYAKAEPSVEGLVPGIGWVHASAHTADALAALAGCHDLSQAERVGLLEGVAVLLFKPDSQYLHRETGRLGQVVLALAVDEDIPDAALEAWLARLGEGVPTDSAKGQNLLRFMQELYFGLKYRTDRPKLIQALERTIALRMRL